ncbi:MAG: hypothetical protein EOR22_23565 [Mesorhizobium sp.]|nr:MAG: hypothetical protein EOR22_23565 [Mesorhizobium sp.]
MSIWEVHFSALYASPIAVDAVLTLGDTAGTTIELRAIDKTAPAALEFKGADVLDVKPGATVRASSLADIEPADLVDCELTLNGVTWRIASHQPLPAPTGEAAGEIMLILTEI